MALEVLAIYINLQGNQIEFWRVKMELAYSRAHKNSIQKKKKKKEKCGKSWILFFIIHFWRYIINFFFHFLLAKFQFYPYHVIGPVKGPHHDM